MKEQQLFKHSISIPAPAEPLAAELREAATLLSKRAAVLETALTKLDRKAVAEHEKLSAQCAELRAKAGTMQDDRCLRAIAPLDSRLAELELRLDGPNREIEKSRAALIEVSENAYELFCRAALIPAQAGLCAQIETALAPFVTSPRQIKAITNESQAMDGLRSVFPRFNTNSAVPAEDRAAFARQLARKIEAVLAGTFAAEFGATPGQLADEAMGNLRVPLNVNVTRA